jgi:hypothetical protein
MITGRVGLSEAREAVLPPPPGLKTVVTLT